MCFPYRNNAFMRCSILLAVSFAIGAWAQAQAATQEEIDRAIELLRKTPVAPPPAGRTNTTTNPSTNAAAATKPQAPATVTPTSPATADMERRARELLQNEKPQPHLQPAPSPATEVIERARAREDVRQQAIQETRRGLPQTETAQPATLAQEQQRKSQDEIERQKNIERIEMEVQRARIAREQKAAQVLATKTNTPAPAVAVTPAVVLTPAPVTEPQPTPPPQPVQPAPVVSTQPATSPPVVVQQTPAPQPATPPVVVPQQPVIQPTQPTVVQQVPAPAPVPEATPASQRPAQAAPSFKGLAPDMEQRARDILNQVMANTEKAPLPVLAVEPPKPAPVVPAPQPQIETKPATIPTPAAVRGPEAPATPAVAAPSTPAAPITADQEAKARALLNQLTTQPTSAAVAPAPTPAPVATPEVTRTVPPVVITPAAPVTPKASAPASQTESLAPDQEARARQLLNQTLTTLPTPAPAATAETKFVPESDRRAQEDARRQAKLKAEIDEQTRREIARMEEESQARAREMAKRRLEEEKRAQRKPQKSEPEVKPATAVRSAPEPVQPKPTVAAKPAEKPKGGKTDAVKAPVKAPVQETWRNASNPREQRLAELLEAYRNDQISAQQYHSERAKILASP